MFFLSGITICKCNDNNKNFEDFVVLKQMSDDFKLKIGYKQFNAIIYYPVFII